MPRQPRIDLPGYLYHVIVRGIERKPIFKNQYDYNEFLRRLQDVLELSGGKCFAWVLMPNHVHMLLRSGVNGIADMMRKLLTGYALYFNIRYKRAGHLFQNRYKSTLCDENTYLMILVRYIHLNPLKAKLVKNIRELGDYPWCGHGVLVGRRKGAWQERDSVLGLFGNTEENARNNYMKYIEDGLSGTGNFEGGGLIRSISHGKGTLINRRIPGQLVYDERILGDGKFINNIYSKVPGEGDGREKENITLDEVIEKVSKKFGLDLEVVLSRMRNRSVEKARILIVYIGVIKLRMSHTHVGRMLHISQSGVSKILKRNHESFKEYVHGNILEVISS